MLAVLQNVLLPVFCWTPVLIIVMSAGEFCLHLATSASPHHVQLSRVMGITLWWTLLSMGRSSSVIIRNSFCFSIAKGVVSCTIYCMQFCKQHVGKPAITATRCMQKLHAINCTWNHARHNYLTFICYALHTRRLMITQTSYILNK